MRLTKYELTTTKNVNIKIGLLSDIHYSGKTFHKGIFKSIIKELSIMKPDYICIPGDFIDFVDVTLIKDNNEVLHSFFSDLSKIAPTIVSIGNHEMKKINNRKTKGFNLEEYLDYYSNIKNLYILNNTKKAFKNIVFYGMTLPYEYYDESKQIINYDIVDYFDTNNIIFEPDKYNIMLCHTPLIFQNEALFKYIKNVDLVLSGHMHNGAIPLAADKFIIGSRGIIGPKKKLFPKYTRGKVLVNNKRIPLIISRGITTLSDTVPGIIKLFRFLYPRNMEQISVDYEEE